MERNRAAQLGQISRHLELYGGLLGFLALGLEVSKKTEIYAPWAAAVAFIVGFAEKRVATQQIRLNIQQSANRDLQEFQRALDQSYHPWHVVPTPSLAQTSASKIYCAIRAFLIVFGVPITWSITAYLARVIQNGVLKLDENIDTVVDELRTVGDVMRVSKEVGKLVFLIAAGIYIFVNNCRSNQPQQIAKVVAQMSSLLFIASVIGMTFLRVGYIYQVSTLQRIGGAARSAWRDYHRHHPDINREEFAANLTLSQLHYQNVTVSGVMSYMLFEFENDRVSSGTILGVAFTLLVLLNIVDTMRHLCRDNVGDARFMWLSKLSDCAFAGGLALQIIQVGEPMSKSAYVGYSIAFGVVMMMSRWLVNGMLDVKATNLDRQHVTSTRNLTRQVSTRALRIR